MAATPYLPNSNRRRKGSPAPGMAAEAGAAIKTGRYQWGAAKTVSDGNFQRPGISHQPSAYPARRKSAPAWKIPVS